VAFPAAYYTTRFTIDTAADPLPPQFAIVTAHNPWDRRRSPPENAAADRELRQQLERQRIAHFRAIGHAPDHSHAEAGWALIGDLAMARHLARDFGQRALWWIDGDQLHLVAATGDHAENLGPFRSRLD
jgi:hypothetical protein